MMENKNFWSRVVPGFVQKQITKSWLPLGGGMSDAYMGMGAPTWMKSGKEAMISDGMHMNPDLYSVVSFITMLAGQIEWVLYEVKDEKWLRRYKNMDPTDSIMANIYEKKALEPVQAHQMLDTWKHPNEYQGQSEFMQQYLGYKLITGDTYAHGQGPISGPNVGLFIMFEALPSQLIGIKYGGPMKPVGHYYWLGDPSRTIPAEQVIHCKYANYLPVSHGGLYGLSPLKAGSRLITRSNEALTTSVRTYQNQGAAGILSRPLGATDKPLTVQQARQVEQKYYENYGGSKKAGRIMATGAQLQWTQLGLSPVDLGILESEKMDLRRICNLYHLQSQLFNDPENKSYNNMKEARTAAYTNAVIPEMRAIRDEFNRGWVQQWSKRDGKNYWLDMDLQAIPEMQMDYKSMMEWLNNATMLTENEKREVIDYDTLEVPGMDEVWVDGNRIPMSQAMIDPGPMDKWMDERL